MSGGGGKTVQKEESTQKVELPAWMTSGGKELYNQAQAVSAANPVTAYSGPIAPGMAANQTQAGQQAAASAHTGQQDIEAARAATAAGANGSGGRVTADTFDRAAAQRYASPFIGEVQQRTVDEMKRQNAMGMASLGDQAQAAHAYGGDRHAIAEAETAKGDNNNILDYLARSNAASYENAQGQFNADRGASMSAQGTNAGLDQSELDRKIAAGGQYGGLSSTASGVNSDNIRNLLMTGQTAQDTQGAQLGSKYNEFLRMQDAPVDRVGDLMAILTGTPHDTTQTTNGTTTTQQKGSLLNTLLGLGQMAGSVAMTASDPRLKTDVVSIGHHPSGLPLYAYRYRHDLLAGLPAGRHIGVMASDVALYAPHALGPTIEGYATVDYSKLGGLN